MLLAISAPQFGWEVQALGCPTYIPLKEGNGTHIATHTVILYIVYHVYPCKPPWSAGSLICQLSQSLVVLYCFGHGVMLHSDGFQWCSFKWNCCIVVLWYSSIHIVICWLEFPLFNHLGWVQLQYILKARVPFTDALFFRASPITCDCLTDANHSQLCRQRTVAV